MSDSAQSSPAASAAPAAVEATEAQDTSPEIEASEESSEVEGQEVEAGAEDNGQVSQDETDAAAKKLKAKEVQGSDGQKFKIKVDGQEIELTQDELVRHAQMGKAGQRAMQEKAELQKRTANFIKALQNDPESILADEAILGSREKVIELAQKILSKQLEEEALSPEQKKLREMEMELEKHRKEKLDSEEKRKKDDYESEVKKYEEDLQIKVQEALEAENLPKKPAILNKMADIMLTAHDNNLKISPRKAAQLAKEELMNDIRELLPVMADDQLDAFFGEELISRIRKSSMKKVKAAVPSVKVNVSGKTVKDDKEETKKKVDMKDFMKSFYFNK